MCGELLHIEARVVHKRSVGSSRMFWMDDGRSPASEAALGAVICVGLAAGGWFALAALCAPPSDKPPAADAPVVGDSGEW